MAGSYNKVILIGYLGRDPEMRYTPNGTPVANFSVGCTESWTDKDAQKQERTTWFGCAAFDRLAETCSQYLHKGSYVYIEGTLSLREYTDRDGVRRSSLDCRVREMRMLDKARGAADAHLADDLAEQVRSEQRASVLPAGELQDVPF